MAPPSAPRISSRRWRAQVIIKINLFCSPTAALREGINAAAKRLSRLFAEMSQWNMHESLFLGVFQASQMCVIVDGDNQPALTMQPNE